jgi:hypothetical protein
MTDTTQRNQEILTLYRAGTTSRALSTRFGISYGRVTMIVRALQEVERRKQKSLEMAQTLKACNDLNRQWKATDLIEMLMLHKRFQKLILAHFQSENRATISLNDILELISPMKRQLREFEYAPLTSIKHIGKKGLRFYIMALSSLDLGEVFHKELRVRVGMLR